MVLYTVCTVDKCFADKYTADKYTAVNCIAVICTADKYTAGLQAKGPGRKTSKWCIGQLHRCIVTVGAIVSAF